MYPHRMASSCLLCVMAIILVHVSKSEFYSISDDDDFSIDEGSGYLEQSGSGDGLCEGCEVHPGHSGDEDVEGSGELHLFHTLTQTPSVEPDKASTTSQEQQSSVMPHQHSSISPDYHSSVKPDHLSSTITNERHFTTLNKKTSSSSSQMPSSSPLLQSSTGSYKYSSTKTDQYSSTKSSTGSHQHFSTSQEQSSSVRSDNQVSSEHNKMSTKEPNLEENLQINNTLPKLSSTYLYIIIALSIVLFAATIALAALCFYKRRRQYTVSRKTSDTTPVVGNVTSQAVVNCSYGVSLEYGKHEEKETTKEFQPEYYYISV